MNHRIAIVGGGRLGHSLSSALRAAQIDVLGPQGRGETGSGSEIVLLCVPDAQIATAAGFIAPGRIVGHCSGALSLDVLAPHEAFSLHPLMTIADGGASFRGVTAAVDGATDRARAIACDLASAVGMTAVTIRESDRAAYHAAASLASNYLVTVESAAARLASTAGLERAHLVPLVRAAVDTWARLGSAALTGPVARGDSDTVARQRAAVEQHAPELLPVWDALTDATRALASRNAMGEV
jgi:predicted short-subunit dehydrogenase-like oxidoreductase (DUF2520 family)